MNDIKVLKNCTILVYLVSMIIIFCACGDKDDEKYIESEIILPAGMNHIWDFTVTEDGKMQAAMTEKNTNKGYLWESTDSGKTWSEACCYTDIMGIEDPEKVDCVISLSGRGDAICMVADNTLDDSNIAETECYYIENAESSKKITNTMPESKVSDSLYVGSGFSWDGLIIDQDRLLISNQSGETYFLDRNTNEIVTTILDSKNPLFSSGMFMLDGDDLYLIGIKDVVQYDVISNKIVKKNDKTLEKVKKTNINSDKPAVMTAHKGEFYLFNENGIQKFSAGKKTNVVSKKDMSIIPAEVYGSKIYIDEKERLYLAINQENDSPRLLYYEKDNKKNKEKDILSIYTLRKDEGVQKLADYYQKKNKNIQTKVIVGLQEDDNKKLDDAIKKLNTSMLGGDGPDIIFLDGLNVNTYLKSNMLLQLDSEIGEMNSKDNFKHIIKSFSQEGETHAVPVRFSVPIVLSKYRDIVDAKNGDAFLSCIQKHDIKVDEYTFPNDVRFYYQVFLENNIEIQQLKKSKVQNFIENIKLLYDITENHENARLSHLALPPQQTGGCMNYLLDSSDLALDYILDGRDLQMLQQLNNTEYGISSNEKGVCYMPRLIVGINANTKQKDLSEDFIAYILSEDGQKITGETMGLPVNKMCLSEVLKSLQAEPSEIGNDSTSKVFQFSVLSEAEINNFIEQIQRTSQQTNNNSIVMNIFMEYTEKYLNGEINEKKAIREIVNRLELYTNE